MLVDLAENDILVAEDELLSVIAAILLSLVGTPGDDGGTVAEIGLKAVAAEV